MFVIFADHENLQRFIELRFGNFCNNKNVVIVINNMFPITIARTNDTVLKHLL